MIEKWKFISRKVLLTHPRMNIVEDVVELPTGKQTTYIRHAPNSPEAALVIAINDKGQILVQQEYSYPPNEVMWQFPGGLIEDGETPESTALRELQEESGYIAKTITPLGYYYLSNRRTDARQFVFVCTDLTEHQLEPDPEEFIETSWIEVDELKKMIVNGEITNITMLASLQLWFSKN